MIMKKFLNYLFALTLVITTFVSTSAMLNNNITFENTKQHLACERTKVNPPYNKFNSNKVEYEITNDNTELVTGLVAQGGGTDGSRIIEVKAKNLQLNFESLKININLDLIDLKESYYITGDVGNNNNFIEHGNRIKIMSKELIINNEGIFYLHLADKYGIDDNSYLELGFNNWLFHTRFNINQLESMAYKLNVKFNFSSEKKEQFIIWLNNYKFNSDQCFIQSTINNSKGFNIAISDLTNEYRDFLNLVDYDKKPEQNINIQKLNNIIKNIANENLEKILYESESNINMHGYNLQSILNNKPLPKTKLEVNNYSNGKSFGKWLQYEADIKFYFWQLRIKVTISSLTLLFLIVTIVVLLYIRYRKIYQPLTLKEINLTKEKIKYFKHNKTIIEIYKFIKLNSKINKHIFWNKYNFNTFLLIQEILKNNLINVNYSRYDNIFPNKKNKKFLLGKQFISIFLNCKDFSEYDNKIKINYPNCFSNKLHKVMLHDFLLFDIDKVKNSAVLISEVNFDVSTKIKLAKIRLFLENQEWNYYFFDLQNLMHLTLINFLNWKDKGLNFNAYGKVLKRKLFWILQSEEKVECYLQIIQTINFYRNLLSKVSPSRQSKLIEWNQLNDKEKEEIVWKIYFSLVEFINFINNHLNEEMEK